MGNYTVADLAYTAGLFDGEGNIDISVTYPNGKNLVRNPSYSLTVSLRNTYRPIIDWMKDNFSGFVTDYSHTPSRTGYRPIWRWSITGTNAKDFLRSTLPYLKIKRHQATLAIAFQTYRHEYHRTRWTTESETQEVIERCETYRQQINSLHLARKIWEGDTTIAEESLTPSKHSTESLAYTAGLFDGEGCIYIQVAKPNGQRGSGKLRYPAYCLRVQLTNTNRPVIQWLHDTFRGCMQDRSSTPSLAGQRPIWLWYDSGDRAQQFLALIGPFLKIKQQQASLGIEFQTINRPFARRTPEALERKEAYRQQISDLNQSHILPPSLI